MSAATVANVPLIASAPVIASAPAASAPVTASAPVMASTPVVTVDVYGDDAMEGFGGINSFPMIVSPTEPADTQAALQAQFNDTGITVANHATGGGSSSLMNEMLGMDGNGAPFADRIKASPAVIVLDNHAINDVYSGETVSDYSGYLGQWIQAVRAAGKIPILEEPGPVCDGQHPALGDYVQAMDDAAMQYGVTLVSQYAYLQTVPDWQSHMTACFYPDAYIDSLKAQREAAVLAPLVKTAIGE